MLRRQSSPDVAPSPQAKGKIERRFGTLQNRLVALLAYEKITAYAPAQELLGRELARQNRTVFRTTARSPDEACAQAQAQGRTVGGGCPDPACWTCTCAAPGPPRQRRSPNQLPRAQLAHPCQRPADRDPHSPSPEPVLGRITTTQTTPKPLARYPRKILTLTQSHFVPPSSLILNSRRHTQANDLRHAGLVAF